MGKHTNFILRPIEKNLEDATCAIRGISGMARIPLNEYFLQSVFLRMTGEQEQKMKCICWELATDDYDYRYKTYYERWNLGQCSKLDEKNKVYGELCEHIQDYKVEDVVKQGILNQAKQIIDDFYNCAGLFIGNERAFTDFSFVFSKIVKSDICSSSKLLKSTKSANLPSTYSVADIYTNNLYRHRNRCAHNTLSYQEPSITLTKLESDNVIYENYFLYFALLIMIDKLFIHAYNAYLLQQEY